MDRTCRQGSCGSFFSHLECVCGSQHSKEFDCRLNCEFKYQQKTSLTIYESWNVSQRVTGNLWYHETLSGTCQSLWCSCLHLPLGAADWQGGWFEVCSAQLCSLRWHCSHVVMPAAELSGYLTHVPSRRFPPRRCVSVTCAVHSANCVLQSCIQNYI